MAQSQTTEEGGELAIDKCYICLCSFEEQTVGSLENCQHVFCFDCIFQWSKTANTCPVDRTRFTSIHQRQWIGGAIQKEIKIPAPRSDVQEEERNVIICENCGRSDRRNQVLVCTCCDSGYHINCLTPAESEAPDDDWMCPECQFCFNQPGIFADEERISDGELEDILSEVDETTSSRFRPSTLNQPGSSSGPRRSQRMQTRSNRNPSTPPSVTCVPKYLLQPPTNVTTEN